MSNEIDRLRRAAIATVDEARKHANEVADAGRWLPKHHRYPHLDHFAGGLPRVTHGEGPTQWSGLFGRAKWHTLRPEQLSSWKELVGAAENVPSVFDRLALPMAEEPIRSQLAALSLGAAVLSVLDRAMQFDGRDFTEQDALTEWMPLERWLTSEEALKAKLVVPLPMTTCPSGSPLELAPGIRLEMMTQDEQLAHVPLDNSFGQANPVVVAATTHAVVFDGIEVPAARLAISVPATARDFVDERRVDQVVQALRIASGLTLGYAQLYLRPLGWATHYTGVLPDLYGELVLRRYPPSFDDYRWLKAPQVLTAQHVDDAGRILSELDSANARLKLAARRLGQAQLRDDEDDAVLDACIALEATVGDDQTSEMRHKVSMRAAVLFGEAGGDAESVLRAVKALYDWRSKLVHGGDVAKSRRAFTAVFGAGEDLGRTLAVVVASQALKELLLHPEITKGADIDIRMLPQFGSSS